MKSEIEVKFLSVDHDGIRQKLLSAGGVCDQPMRLLRRYVVEDKNMLENSAFLRVRDEGNKVTMTYKQFDELSIDGAKEIEITVSSFEDSMQLIKTIFPVLNRESYQESKRETWTLDGVEIVLDEWPWLNPYIEIEGESKQAVSAVANKLEFNWNDAVFGDVMAAFRVQYPHLTKTDTIGDIAEVRFENPLPDLLIKS